MENLRLEATLQKASESLSLKFLMLKQRLLSNEYIATSAGFPGGNDHGPEHIKRVLKYLDELLGPDQLAHVSAYELWIAAMAVLYHDIGILRGRKGHAAKSAELLLRDGNSYIFDEVDKNYIELAVFSHSSSVSIDEKCQQHEECETAKGAQIRPRLVCALVRLADELDEDFRRSPPSLQEKLDLPDESRVYWAFNQRVFGVGVSRPSSEISLNVQLNASDYYRKDYTLSGKPISLADFALKKFVKLNDERRTCNKHLPPSLRLNRIRLGIRVKDRQSVPLNIIMLTDESSEDNVRLQYFLHASALASVGGSPATAAALDNEPQILKDVVRAFEHDGLRIRSSAKLANAACYLICFESSRSLLPETLNIFVTDHLGAALSSELAASDAEHPATRSVVVYATADDPPPTTGSIQPIPFGTIRQRSFDVGAFGAEVIARYEVGEVSRLYVDTECFASPHLTRELEDDHLARGLGVLALRRHNAVEVVQRWVKSSAARVLLIEGDYGTGKTTFLSHLQYLQAKSIFAKEDSYILPLLIPLKEFSDNLSEASLDAYLQKTYKITTTTRGLVQLFGADRVVLLFDGFDEMGFISEHRLRRMKFIGLLHLVMSCGVKSVISGRPGYFESSQEIDDMVRAAAAGFGETVDQATETSATADTIEIAPLRDPQVKEYIDKYARVHLLGEQEVERIRGLIQSTYDLSDLCTRPFLLGMIVEVFKDRQARIEARSAASLYRIYTDRWIDRDEAKGSFRWLILRSDRLELMRLLAEKMHASGTLEVHYSDLSTWVATLPQMTKGSDSVDYIAHDIATCSFVARDENGHYGFMHKSFMDYFLASRLYSQAVDDPAFDLSWLFDGETYEAATQQFFVEMILDAKRDGRRAIRPLAKVQLSPDAALRAAASLSAIGGDAWKLLPELFGGPAVDWWTLRVSEGPRGQVGGHDNAYYAGLFGAGTTIGGDAAANGSKLRSCSFCRRTQREVRKLVAGPECAICALCIVSAIVERLAEPAVASDTVQPPPSQPKNPGATTADRCSFCEKSGDSVKIYAGRGADRICTECVTVASEIIVEHTAETADDQS
ncbi:MAG: NACHT domain-containing protein [Deltaproteobacteria bacterium]|nr:NACHT domain-containing protein [Deltaproteobacteria bacterium]